MSKLFDKKSHDLQQRSYENRQQALERLQACCIEHDVCAACGASAGLYLAALAATAIGFDREKFLALAAEVWDDLQQQELEAPVN